MDLHRIKALGPVDRQADPCVEIWIHGRPGAREYGFLDGGAFDLGARHPRGAASHGNQYVGCLPPRSHLETSSW